MKCGGLSTGGPAAALAASSVALESMLQAAWSAEGIAGLPLCTTRAPLSCTTLPGLHTALPLRLRRLRQIGSRPARRPYEVPSRELDQSRQATPLHLRWQATSRRMTGSTFPPRTSRHHGAASTPLHHRRARSRALAQWRALLHHEECRGFAVAPAPRAGAEWRVDIDEIDSAVRQLGKKGEIVAPDQAIGGAIMAGSTTKS